MAYGNYMTYGTQYVSALVTSADSGTGTDEVQLITPSDATPDAGTWTITFRGYTTSALAANASANDIRDALYALPSIGTGNIAISGTLGTTVQITFQADLGKQNVPAVTTTSTLTKSAVAVTLAVSTTTPGVNVGTQLLAPTAGIRYEIDSIYMEGTISSGSFQVGFDGNAKNPVVAKMVASGSTNAIYPQPGNGGHYTSGIGVYYSVVDSGTPNVNINVGYHIVPTTNAGQVLTGLLQ